MQKVARFEKIYFKSIKDYFVEVEKDYYNGNYRSAIVLLYSIVICDLIYKLQELRDVYNDKVACTILNAVETAKFDDDKTKWERDLVNEISQKTAFLDSQSLAFIDNLKKQRNLCAHPALNEEFKLITPSAEQTMALMVDSIDLVLSKHPLIASNMVDFIAEDLKEKKGYYQNDLDALEDYLKIRYLDKMSESSIKGLFKSLWKFCFRLTDDECKQNRVINRKALTCIYRDYGWLYDFIKNDSHFQITTNDDDCCRELSIFLTYYPEIYELLSDDSKKQLNEALNKHIELKITSWYLNKNKLEHLGNLKSLYFEFDQNTFGYVKKCYFESGLKNEFINFCIEYFGDSGSYDSADYRFEIVVRSILQDLNHVQVIKLISVINDNSQCSERWRALGDNNFIITMYKDEILNDELTQFTNFKFDENILVEKNMKDEAKK